MELLRTSSRRVGGKLVVGCACLSAMVLGCGGSEVETTPEPLPDIAPEAEPFNNPDRKKRHDPADDFGSDELVIPLLRVASDALPRTVEGLRPAGPPGEYDIDPKTFDWAGPRPRDGRFRYQQGNLRRVSINVAGRENCDELIEAISAPHGEPKESRCAERIWQTENFGIRYLERPQQATCSVVIMVDGAFPPLVPDGNALTAAEIFGVELGTPIADYADIAATKDRLQIHRRSTGNPKFPGVETYGPTWTFFDDKLADVTVRANEEDCIGLRDHLVAEYGPGTAGNSDTDLNWVGCEYALEYRFNGSMLACRATARSLPEYFARTEWEGGKKGRRVAEKRAELEAYVTTDGDTVTVTKGIVDWLNGDPARAATPYRRKPMTRSRDGVGAGFKITGLPAGGLLHTIGIRERDWLLAINGEPAGDYEPGVGETELELTVRRGGSDHVRVLIFEDGVLDQIRQIRGQFP